MMSLYFLQSQALILSRHDANHSSSKGLGEENSRVHGFFSLIFLPSNSKKISFFHHINLFSFNRGLLFFNHRDRWHLYTDHVASRIQNLTPHDHWGAGQGAFIWNTAVPSWASPVPGLKTRKLS